ncbi:phosphoglycerate kinase [bacterium]|nr:phosphoglycerate kinase [bacterium]
MPKLTIDDLSLKGKRVLVRVDFNVPLDEDGRITDDLRIRESLPTIRKIIQSGGKAVLMSHLGRPKGKVDKNLRMTPTALRLSEYLKLEIKLAPDCVGPDVLQLTKELAEGEILLLENLRFHKEEEANAPAFAAELAELGDVYVNDAFGTAHRAHASTEGVTHHISPCAAGYLMRKEIEYLHKAVAEPKKPFTIVLGGAKVKGKIEIIENLIGKVDTILIGGGMSFTFIKAEGYEVGNSLLEADKIELASETMKKAKEAGIEFILPSDIVIAREMKEDAESKVVPIDKIESGWAGYDIGPETITKFSGIIEKAGTVLWNGPMGVFEIPQFAAGTKIIADSLAEATGKGAVTIVGGGDSAAAIQQFGLSEKVSHVSTGGGASLEFLGGIELPGIAALTDRKV